MNNLAEYRDPALLKKLIQSNDLKDRELLNSIVVKIIDESAVNHFTLLLENGYTIDVFNEKRHTALHYAFYRCRSRIIEAIVKWKPFQNDSYDYIDSNGLSHLHIICTKYYEGVLEVIKNYLNNGSDINACCHDDPHNQYDPPWYDQCTPLHFAMAHNQCSIAQFLLENGANINAADSKGRTPLHLACQMNRPEDISQIIELLVNIFHANLEAKDEHGDTPLLSLFDYRITHPELAYDFCIEYEKSKLDILLKHGANIMAKNDKGDTVLHLAIKTLRLRHCNSYLPRTSFDDTKYAEVVEQILNYNSDLLDAKNNKGETPLQLAFSMTSLDVVQVLVDHNADVSLLKIDNGNKEIFRYPKIVAGFEVVKNILNIIRLIGDRGLKFGLEENLMIMKFLAHEVDICQCSDDDENSNKCIKFFYLLECGTATHTKQVLRDLIINNRIETDLISYLWRYLNVIKEGNFYLDEEIKEILTELTAPLHANNHVLTAEEKQDMKRLKSDVKLKNGMMLYDLMLKHPYTSTRLLTQDNFDCKLLEGFRCPYFKDLIEGFITKATVRNYMIESVYAFLPLSPLASLPDLCNEIILSYLSNADIFNLCSSVYLQDSDVTLTKA